MAIPSLGFVYVAWWIVFITIGEDFLHTSTIVYTLILLNFILLQSSIYWYICLRRINGKKVPEKTPYIY